MKFKNLLERLNKLENLLPGGKGDKLTVKDVDPDELKIGLRIELEHTRNKELAQEIALDHLSEDPKYYSKLLKAMPKERNGL